MAASAPRKSNPGSPWTDQETSHLIDVYEHRWYSLKRGQLKAQQWEDIAIEISARCGFSIPSKNATQCRHKIEKLRKRYRSERLRPVKSSWPFFERIDLMEVGPMPISAVPASSDEDDDDSRVGRKILKRKRLEEEDCGDLGEMAAELRRFGEGYVRMERKRMDVMREMEREWMEMEARRMEMIMEAQRGIMETIAGAFSKKAKNPVDM